MLHRNLNSNNSSYQMLVVDLDGTLLTREKRIREVDREAIYGLRELGVHVTIATGRLYSGTEHVAHELEIEGLVACMNGSDVIDTATGSSRSRRALPVEERRRIRDRLSKSDVRTVLFASRTIQYGSGDEVLRKRFSSWSERFEEVGEIFTVDTWHAEDEVLAVVGVGPQDEVLAIGDELRSWIHDEREVLSIPSMPSGNGFLMVRDGRENKGTALRRLAGEHGVDPQNVVCVGDWVNDVPMLESEARSFVMGGAPVWVSDAADSVLDTQVHEGGAVAEIARRVWDLDV